MADRAAGWIGRGLRQASPRRVLAVTCGNHAVHDGYTDTLYLLLPLWQAEFQLSYAAVGIMRALYSAVLAAFQVPAASLAVRVSPVLLLAAGTALSGLAYMLAGASAGLPLLVVSLMLGGLGSSTLHPIGSDLVASAFHGNSVRPALGTFNFAGDVGKMAFPTGASLLLAFMSWRETAFVIGGIGVASALAVLLLLPYAQPRAESRARKRSAKTDPFAIEHAQRISHAARDRHRGQRDPHGLHDVPALRARRQGRVADDDGPGVDPDLCRRRVRQARLRPASARVSA